MTSDYQKRILWWRERPDEARRRFKDAIAVIRIQAEFVDLITEALHLGETVMPNEPQTINVNEVLDFLIDELQNAKNHVVNFGDKVIDVGQGGVKDVNGLIDQAIDKLQELKG